jgi:hypothetical protein
MGALWTGHLNGKHSIERDIMYIPLETIASR